MPLMPVPEHLADCLALAAPLPAETVSLTEALGRALAAPVTSPVSLPGCANSAMDGYAVHPQDLAQASGDNPTRLTVVDDLPAGRVRSSPFARGEAVRIMTGACVPPGTGAVVQVERTDAGTDQVLVYSPVDPGESIRQVGEDVRAGEELLASGAELTSRRIGLLAAAGVAHVQVHRAPRVLVLATGSELVEPGQALRPGQLHESNAHLLQAQVTSLGMQAVRPPIVPDEPEALAQVLQAHAGAVDLVLTSGGVSAGAYDTVKEVLSATGAVSFRKVAMQPGMPQGCGTVTADGRTVPILTLPGNPVSTFVSFLVFATPVLRRLAGLTEPVGTIPAVASKGWRSPQGKVQYARARLHTEGDMLRVAPVGGQRSHLVADLAASDALAIVPAESTQVDPGDIVHCLVLNR
ncbi:MAG: gephyrin-like molybdotransferase Glp [Actinomycetales bacterium]